MSSIKEKLRAKGQTVLDSRAQLMYDALKSESDRNLFELRANVREIKGKIESLEDLSIRNTTSLTVGSGIDAKQWITDRNNLALKLYDAKKRLGIALLVADEEFPETDEEGNAITNEDDECRDLASK